ncbi:MAG: hypothetical protein JWQ09_5118 [Segetibacter sp.]|nr:hypothetical protein [Segetibacter sp.]
MKKIVFSLTLLLFVVKSFSQEPTSPALSKDYYLKKSKNQKTVAWILLAGGTVMAVGGAISFSHNYDYGSNSATDISGFLLLGGIVSDIVSIPFFTSSSKNKRKAASIAISNQNIFLPRQNSFALKTQPTITLKIGF